MQQTLCKAQGNRPAPPVRHSSRRLNASAKDPGALTLLLALLLSAWVMETHGANLAYRAVPGAKVAALPPPAAGKTGFTLLAPETTGIRFTNRLAEARSLTNHILLNGSGVAAGDMDGDGWCDLFFCGLGGQSALYRNQGGWRFEDVTVAAGVACPDLDATGAVFADIDGDGDLDLLVTSIGHGVKCFRNDGHGRFTEVTTEAGLSSVAGSMSMTLADIDGDGDLDLYVANYRTSTARDAFRMQIRVTQVAGKQVITMVNGRPVTEPDLIGRFTLNENGGIVENGEADVLYRNDGKGHFTPLSFTDGTFLDEDGHPFRAPLYDWSLTAMFRDLNGDGAPDLYVCGDLASPDRIWINDGAGRFRAVRRTAVRKTSWFSMGVDCADLDRDGHDEIFVTDMVSRDHRMRQVQVSDHQPVFGAVGVFEDRPQTPRNTLQWNCGDGDYLEMAYAAGLHASEWSWSPVFLDVDLDGYEDVLIATGFERDVQDVDIAQRLEAMRQDQRLSDPDALRLRKMFPRLDLPNLAFRNDGNLGFEDVSTAWGFDTKGVSQGVALADLDNDGDLDVIVNNMNGPAGIYRNETPAPRLAVRLKGTGANTRGVGAKIRVFGGAVPEQSQEMQAGGRYLSSDDSMRVFAAGQPTNRLRVEVNWRSGRRSVVPDLSPNSLLEVDEASARPPTGGVQPAPAVPMFENVSQLLRHTHQDADFDDFERQALLPRKLSQLGPGVAWADLDGDGWEDLIIGAGRGGVMSVFHNDGRGGFQPVTNSALAVATPRDLTGVVTRPQPSGKPAILVGQANYEDGLPLGSSVRTVRLGEGRVEEDFPGGISSAGPLALADVDGDGGLDLFVGGRVIGGRYPEPASSRLYRSQNGKLVEDPAATRQFEKLGLVSSAVFSDLDGDGYPELILACEWGPIRVFRNAKGTLTPWDPPLLSHDPAGDRSGGGSGNRVIPKTLAQMPGWWNGVTAGDFNGDGRMDFIGSNWGQNTKYQEHRTQPLRLYYGDFAESGGVDVFEGYFDTAMGKVVPWQHLGRFAQALPSVRDRYTTFRQFGEAGVMELLGSKASAARELQANWLETTLFLNRTNGFEVVPLPALAQWSPAFAVCVADIDGDGNEDAFLSQNFFGTEPETGRYDAGRGLWLRGDGHGGLHPMPGRESGVLVYGEQRGAAVCDYDGDGRTDLVVSQNGAATQLFHNLRGKPGLRIRLRGPAGNPDGIGAVLRLRFADRLGPAREVHAGAGYWSQDSAIQVLGLPSPPVAVEVRWPGGRTNSTPVPSGAREVEVR